jgi:DNA-binding GntR family transcriptional regulator
MKEKIMTHLHNQMNQLKIKEHEFVAKALKQKDMDKAVAVSQEHEELNKKYNDYYKAFEFQKLFGNVPTKA